MNKIPFKTKILHIIRNTFHVKSLQFVLSISFTLISITGILVFGSILYAKFTGEIEKQEYNSTKQITDRIAVNIEYHLKNMIELSDFINFKLFMNNDIDNPDFRQMLDIMFKTYDDIISLNVYDPQGECVLEYKKNYVPDNLIDVGTPWYNITKESNYGSFFNLITNRYKINHISSRMIALSKRIKFYSTNKDIDGVMILLMNFRSVDEMLNQAALGEKGYVYIIDPSGNIVYHPQRELIDLGLFTENSYALAAKPEGMHMINDTLYYIKNMKYCEWRMLGVSYLEGITEAKNNIHQLLHWLIILSILLIFLISVFVAARITNPIKKLQRYLNKVEKGMLNVRLNLKGEEEIVDLSHAFNSMVKQIKALMQQVVKEQEDKKKTEFTALQEQINPHFLYNTFDSIIWMAEKGRSAEVITMITSLSKVLRISLSKGQSMITVAEELAHVENYLKIQKVRFQDKLDYNISADENTLNLQTLKLIIQPFVENAICHGFEAMVDKGIIIINASIQNNKLVLVIKDNGIGISEKVLSSITREYKHFKGTGVGIRNVQQRIQLFFGEEYGIKMESELEEGTIITITLPIIEDN